jgi:hypothetical protein
MVAPIRCCKEPIAEYDPPQNHNKLGNSFHVSGTSPPSLAETLRLKLELSDTELRILCRLLAWGQLVHEQICEVMANGHQPVKTGSIDGIIEQLRAKLKPYGIKIGSIDGGEFELRNEDREKTIALGLGNATRPKPKAKPKPTATARPVRKRPAEVPGAKSRRAGKMEPKEQQTRPAAA